MLNLSKINLEKDVAVSLEKPVGKVTLNLNWHREKKASASGLFGRIVGALTGGDGGSAGIDLDLGALYETTDGRKSCVQALGEAWGSFGTHPYLNLSGDDRTGDSEDGEFIFVNGDQWSHIRRILVYAFIYDGVACWSDADGVVLIKVPDQNTLQVNLDNHDADKTMCAVALIENDGGKFKVTKQARYFKGHTEMDRHYGWGLSWVPGSKD